MIAYRPRAVAADHGRSRIRSGGLMTVPGCCRAGNGCPRPVPACRKRGADGCELVLDGRVSVAGTSDRLRLVTDRVRTSAAGLRESSAVQGWSLTRARM